jgi:hypothetical protein
MTGGFERVSVFDLLFSSDIFRLLSEICISTKSKGTASIVATGCAAALRVIILLRVGSLEFNCIVLN